MKDVILFQPFIGDWDSLRTKPSLPIGLLSASCIASRHFRIKLIDQRLVKDWKKEIDDFVSANTVCAGVSSITGAGLKGSLEFSRYIKEHYCFPVVWGGIHASLFPEQTLKDPSVDIIAEREGEHTFYELLRCIENGSSFDSVKGLWYKEGTEIRYTGRRELIDINDLPDLPYDLVDIRSYLPVYSESRSIYFQSSRGCPLVCGYCYNSSFNDSSWRALSAENTVKRIKTLREKCKDIDSIYFVDDNFFVDIERAEYIIRELMNMQLKWFCQGIDILSLKNMSPAFLQLLEESGCLKLTVGIETGSERMRSLICKQGSLEDIMEVNRRLSSRSFIFFCCFMAGFPGEKLADIKATASLIIKMHNINKNFRNSPIYIYTPYPGTYLYKKYYKDADNIPTGLEEWASCDWSQAKLPENSGIIESMSIVSLFLDNKYHDYDLPYLLRFFVLLYRPVAWYRFRKFNFSFMFEKMFYNLFIKIWRRMKSASDCSL